VATLVETFRVLSSFDPPRGSLASAPWDSYVDWAISQGLGPLAAYNLEYRLGGSAEAPEWARDRLLSVYQGSLNDNVMKLVNFKRAIGELEGRRVVLLGAASFSEALYPHVAFRPVLEIEALVPSADLDPVATHLMESQFKRVDPEPGEGADRVLFDGRTRLLFYAGLLGEARRAAEAELLARALPMKVYGPSVFRLELEDALLVETFGHAQSGYQIPAIAWVDFRELLLGAPSMGGAYSRPFQAQTLRERAKGLKVERSLWTSLGIAAELFPSLVEQTRKAMPKLSFPTRKRLERAFVRPLASLQAPEAQSPRSRALLAGG
jgi:hypothetical protein